MPLRSRRRRRKKEHGAGGDRDGIAELYERDQSARLVAVVTSHEAAHNSGCAGVAIARNWAAHDRDVLFVDADASGSALARRLGDATRADFSPATRGLPSLMAARQPLTTELLSQHCWRLSVPGNRAVRLLLGPTSASGAPLAAAWLANRASSLLDASADSNVIVSMTTPLVRGQEAFLRAASAVVLLAPTDTDERFEALRALGSSLTRAAERCSPCLVIDGPTDRSYDEIHAASGLHVAGRLDAVPERVLLGSRTRRRDAKAARPVDELAGRIAFLAAESEHFEPEFEAPGQSRAATAANTKGDSPAEAGDESGVLPGTPNGVRKLIEADR